MPTIEIGIDKNFGRAILLLSADEATDVPQAWHEITTKAALADPSAMVSGWELQLSWAAYLHLAQSVKYLAESSELNINYSDDAAQLLRRWVEDVRATAVDATDVRGRDEEVLGLLVDSDWDTSKRELTESQQRDLLKLVCLQHGANFSVPGAGKTTVATALHEVLRMRGVVDRLVVVAPKNAFQAWDDAVEDCLTTDLGRFTRLGGGREGIARLLQSRPQRCITSYEHAGSKADLLIPYLTSDRVHLLLDESHRIKSGERGIYASEVIRLSPFASRRDILSGTPMPQSINDLSSQFEFLYPASGLAARIRSTSNATKLLRPDFVRTNYSEQGVPEPTESYEAVAMSDPQRALYAVWRDEVIRLHASRGRTQGVDKRSVMSLLRAAIDVESSAERLLVSGELESSNVVSICKAVLDDGLSPRLERAVGITRELVREGKKVVLWAPFISTIDRLADELRDLGSAVIHGGTETGLPETPGTREHIVREFHVDPTRRVIVANPAAGGEGISLHKACQTAIYVGRTYNATHYLQSRDRINRLGMPEGTRAHLIHIESEAPARLGSIDLALRRRMKSKIQAMAEVLNDSDLRKLAMGDEDADPELDDGIIFDDLLDLIDELTEHG